MRIVIFLSMLFIFIFNTATAEATNYPSARIQRYATNTPRSVENNLNTLTKHLIRPLDDDYDKAKMIAFWIASHISYDSYLYRNNKETRLMRDYELQEPSELLESRVGICSDFAEMFAQMSAMAGIEGGIVYGYVYPVGTSLIKSNKKNYSHVWNYFIYKGKKIYVDTTFMSNGKLTVSGSVREFAHKRALHSVERKNKYKSRIHTFDDYYFDFDYKREKSNRKYIRKESGILEW